jgi:hypothetical protein
MQWQQYQKGEQGTLALPFYPVPGFFSPSCYYFKSFFSKTVTPVE